MLFDTDVLIWIQRGNSKAAALLEKNNNRCMSVQSYMELLQCASSKRQHDVIRDFLRQFEIAIVPLSENIGHRASIYVEQYALSNGIRAGDAIIAATAFELNLELASSNAKHFKCIPDLKLLVFKP